MQDFGISRKSTCQGPEAGPIGHRIWIGHLLAFPNRTLRLIPTLERMTDLLDYMPASMCISGDSVPGRICRVGGYVQAALHGDAQSGRNTRVGVGALG